MALFTIFRYNGVSERRKVARGPPPPALLGLMRVKKGGFILKIITGGIKMSTGEYCTEIVMEEHLMILLLYSQW